MFIYKYLILTGRLILLSSGIFVSTIWLACNGENPSGPQRETRYQLTVLASTGGKIITPNQSIQAVIKGTTTTVSARADHGYTFARWVVFGDNASITYINVSDAKVTLLKGNDTVRAEFITVPALPENIDISKIPTQNGVNFLHYNGSLSSLTEFTTMTPDSAGPTDSLSIASLPHGTNGFGVYLSGYLSIPIDGDYTFYLASSDGSTLYLNDSLILSNIGNHAVPVEDSIKLSLKQGAYLIGARYFDVKSSPFLNVSYACLDNGIEKMTIPKEALQRCDTRPVVKITINKPAGGETFHLGDTIHVQWTYKNQRGQVIAQFSVDNGQTFDNITNSAFAGTVSSYDWKIPSGADSLISQTVLILMKEYPPFDAKGVSKKFSIIH